MSSFFHSNERSPHYAILMAAFLLAIATVFVLPNYISGRWVWQQPAPLGTAPQLRQLKEQGISVTGWNTLEQNLGSIGGQEWSVQLLQPTTTEALPTPAILLLRPQTFHKDQPQVEWMDVNGVHRWTVDQRRRLLFQVAPTAGKLFPVTARFFRGWTEQQTYAVLQWYAWAGGGHASPSRWFWVDQWTQWRDRQRMPWVAVSLLIPIRPLGEIRSVEPLAVSLGQQIQAALMEEALHLKDLETEAN
ncbi:MAG: cyanoexosortase B system-associated protein [Leptolyngbyaceae cyanobacterium SL_7_1]|nr:cyanoexosortase B system-associated protein [Leptolyngbyaceae cyanobacterium SL_7_1]